MIATETIIEQMDDIERLRVFVALAVILVLGAILLAVVRAGSRWARRYARTEREFPGKPSGDPGEDRWWQKPIVPSADESSDNEQ
jgi:alkylation response protein AidB-like acyl-CoA dehydrogenase